jgi:phage-related protein
MRWSEEIEILKEEMRRVLQFFLWHEGWWRSKASGWEGLSPAEAEGLSAYASRQAAIRGGLYVKFKALWSDVPKLLDMGARHAEVTGLPWNLP